VPAFLDDYAFLVEGLLGLRRATDEGRWVEEAVALVEEQERRLGGEGGGYFAAGEDPRLLFRARPAFDGAVASGNGVAALNLLDLAELTGDPGLARRGEAVIRAFSHEIGRAPLAHVTLIRALRRLQALAHPAPGPSGEPLVPAGSSAVDALEDEAREAVEIEARLGHGEDEAWKPFAVHLLVRSGFHVNANAIDDPALVPTSVSGVLGEVRNVSYPPGEREGGIPVYRGRVSIEGEVERRGGGASAVEVTFQACDESRCLPPVTRVVRLR
jgi:hypothetical protein